MYRCANCHELFDEPDENHFELTRIDGQRIMAKDYSCPFCKSDAIEEVHQCNGCGGRIELHHIFPGANRKASDRYGMTVYLCHNHHNEPPYGVHFNKEQMKVLQIAGQRRLMAVRGWTVDEFRKHFRKSYI